MEAMSDTKLAVPPEFDTASKEERIEFVQDLWDRIARDQSSVPVPESHKKILDRRLEVNSLRGGPPGIVVWPN
jgi:putative addiction module component (TIGR02574 family)